MAEPTQTLNRLIALEQNVKRLLNASGGGGTYGGMEARIAKLEAAVEYIKSDIHDIKTDVHEIKRDARTDFRLLFGALIAATLGLAALMAKGFNWIG